MLAWYDRAARDLPWRQRPTPYTALVSEAMLQQTVVAAAIPYFTRFIARFPDFAALAAARERDVMAAWSGLGYYRRARSLHRAARMVVGDFGGQLPADPAELRRLPGVGEYTAAALAAIVFGRRVLALDGNAARVLARLHAFRGTIDRPAARARLRVLGEALVPAARPGDFAQAIFDLGATVCLPRAPRCHECPVRARCAGHAQGHAASLPRRAPRRARKGLALACLAIRRGRRVLVVPRPPGALLAGTYGLPALEVAVGGSAAQAARRLAHAHLGTGAPPEPLGEVRHVFTHRDAIARIFVAAAPVGARGGGPKARGGLWVDPARPGPAPLSSFARKMLALLVVDSRESRRDVRRPTRGGSREAHLVRPDRRGRLVGADPGPPRAGARAGRGARRGQAAG